MQPHLIITTSSLALPTYTTPAATRLGSTGDRKSDVTLSDDTSFEAWPDENAHTVDDSHGDNRFLTIVRFDDGFADFEVDGPADVERKLSSGDLGGDQGSTPIPVKSPKWLHDRNSDPFGTDGRDPFWDSVSVERIANWNIFEKDGFWRGYDRLHNAWYTFADEAEARSTASGSSIDPWG